MTDFIPVKLHRIAHYVYLDNSKGNVERRATCAKANRAGYKTHEDYTIDMNQKIGRWTLDIFETVDGKKVNKEKQTK